MEYSHSDAELIKQPIGYWSWAACKSVVTRTRGALAELDLSQPQWWVLHQVVPAGDEGRPRADVTEILRGYLDVGDGMDAEIDGAVAQGWIEEDQDQRLRGTPEGAARYAKAAALQGELWAERHAGFSDEEYLTTLKVLQRIIHNTGGTAWHH